MKKKEPFDKKKSQFKLFSELIQITYVKLNEKVSPHEFIRKRLLENQELLDETALSTFIYVSDSILNTYVNKPIEAMSYGIVLGDFGWMIMNIDSPNYVLKKIAFFAFKTSLSLINYASHFELWLMALSRLWQTTFSIASSAKSPSYEYSWNFYNNVINLPNLSGLNQAKISLVFSSKIVNWIDVSNDKSDVLPTIKITESLLDHFSWDEYPKERKELLISLILLYTMIRQGALYEVYEKCIKISDELLQNVNLENSPSDYAKVKQLVGIMHDTISWAETDLLIQKSYVEKAILALKQSERIFKELNRDFDLAMVQINLGLIFLQRKDGDMEQNIEDSIKFNNSALSYLSLHAKKYSVPVYFNLANCYLKRTKGEKYDNIEDSIKIAFEGLKIAEELKLDIQKHNIYRIIGIAYAQRKNGKMKKNISKSEFFFELALKGIEIEVNPGLRLDILNDLCNIQIKQKEWLKLYETSRSIIDLVESKYFNQIQEYSNIKKISNGIFLDGYKNLALANINLGNIEEGWLFACMSKSIIFNNIAYGKKSSDTSLSPRFWIIQNEILQLDIERNKIESLSYIDTDKIEFDYEKEYFLNLLPTIKSKLKSKKIELNQILKNTKVPAFLNSEKYRQALINLKKEISKKKILILDWYLINEELYIIIYSSLEKKTISYVVSSERFKCFISVFYEFFTNYFSKNQEFWKANLGWYISELSNCLRLDEIIKSELLENVTSLMIIPTSYFHYVPFQALVYREKQLIDLFPSGIIYSNNPIISENNFRFNQTSDSTFYIFHDSNSDLKFPQLETAYIHKLFLDNDFKPVDNKEILNFHNASYIHISSHGYLGFLTSGLNLSKNIKLTNIDIVNLDLTCCKLVVLSSCEGGLVDGGPSRSDNSLKLSTAFQLAGAQNVISAMWVVEDFSTSLLIMKMYEFIFSDSATKDKLFFAEKLMLAQKWLRDSTGKEISQWLLKIVIANKKSNILSRAIDYQISKLLRNPNVKPFNSPYYWAAFNLI